MPPTIKEDGTQLDPKVLKVVRAIRDVESGGDYNAIGDNGMSAGAFQWNNGKTKLHPGQVPANFLGHAREAGVEVPDFSKASQNKVAYSVMKKWKDEGLGPEEIAARWNGAHAGPDGKLTYNAPEYGEKFRAALGQGSGGYAVPGQPTSPGTVPGYAPPVAPQQQPYQQEQAPQEEKPLANKISDFLGFKGATDTFGNLIARAGATEDEKQYIDKPTGGQVVGAALQVGSILAPVGTGARLATGAVRGVLGKAAPIIGKIAAGAGAGYAYDAGQKLAEGESLGEALKPGLGTALGASVPVLGGVVGAVGKASPKLLSYTSDVPEKAFTTMLQRRPQFNQAMKAGNTPESVLKDSQTAVRQLRTQLTNDWDEGVKKVIEGNTGQRVTIGGKLGKNLEKIAEEYGLDLPQNMSNVSANEAIELLKQINALPKSVLTFSPKGALARRSKDELKEKLIKTFGGKDGEFAQLYQNYSAKKGVLDAANQIVQAYQQGKPVQQATARNRLLSLFNDNKAAYLDAIVDLEQATGQDILSKVAALQFSGRLPKGMNAISATSGLLSPKGAFDKFLDLLLFPLTSPRSAGWLARILNKSGNPLRTPSDMLVQGVMNR